jgi:hypothetical protein
VGIARQLHRDFLITLYKMWQTDMKKKSVGQTNNPEIRA